MLTYNSRAPPPSPKSARLDRITTPSRLWIGVIAVTGWTGVLLQLWIAAAAAAGQQQAPLQGVLWALCYFTVLTNILVSITASAVALGHRGRLTGSSALAAVAVYIGVVGLIYSLLLRSLWSPLGVHRLADQILHDVTPVLYVAWWAVCAPKARLAWAAAVRWLAYPLAYILFSVVLGALTGRYLYPFADIGVRGVGAVVRNGLLMLVLFAGLGCAAVAYSRLRRSS